MAPVTAVAPPAPAAKIKRPSGIQTNGVSSSRSSPSPNMTTKRPPTKLNGPSSLNYQVKRPNGVQALGRGRTGLNLRSASLAVEHPVPVEEAKPYVVTDEYILKKFAGNPPSLVVHLHPNHFRFDSQDGIFSYKGEMRIFLQHVRARTIPHEILEYLIQGEVPFYDGCLIVQVHDHKSVVKAKDVARPRSSSNSLEKSSVHGSSPWLTPSPYAPYPNENLGSTDPSAANPNDSKTKIDEDNKENNNVPNTPQAEPKSKSKSPPKPKIITVVLHPTPQCLHTDLYIKMITPRGTSDPASAGLPPPTPSSLVPPTPAASMPPPPKRRRLDRTELDGSNVRLAESQILLATIAPLHLDPVRNADGMIQLLEDYTHPEHSDSPPLPKTRKRTVAEMAADQALAAEEERYMISFDERVASSAGENKAAGAGGDGDAAGGSAAFVPRFERFKLLETIKREHQERKAQEKIKNEEKEQRLLAQRQHQQELQNQQQERERAAAAAAAAEQERAKKEAAARETQAQAHAQAQAQAAQRQELQRRALQQQAAAQAQAAQQNQAAAAAAAAAAAVAVSQAPSQNGNVSAAQTPHSHPGQMPNGAVASAPNGMPISQTARLQQQVSQPPISSPVVRQGTPHSMSSPMVANTQMQRSGSNMVQSPQRPSSVVQSHPPMAAPSMAVSMSARGSQQSHPAGTPRMPNATPNMANATPITRPGMTATPRMTQASPPPGMMAQGPHMGQNMIVNNAMSQPMQGNAMVAAQAQMLAQQQRQMAAMQQGMMNGMNGQQPLTPQQQQQLMQQQNALRQRQMMQHMQQQGMGNPLAQSYAQQLQQMQMHQLQQQRMQQMQAQSQANGMGMPMQNPMAQPNMMGMNGAMMPNGMNQQAHQQLMMKMAQSQGAQQSLQVQIQSQAQIYYQQMLNQTIQSVGGRPEAVTEQIKESLKQRALSLAQQSVQKMIMQRRQQQAQQQQAQQQAQQQQMMAQSMQGMGMMG